MFGNKTAMIADLNTAITMIQKAKEELEKCDTVKVESGHYNYSLAKVKRNCTVARQLLNDVRKNCEQSWSEYK